MIPVQAVENESLRKERPTRRIAARGQRLDQVLVLMLPTIWRRRSYTMALIS